MLKLHMLKGIVLKCVKTMRLDLDLDLDLLSPRRINNSIVGLT